MLEKINSPVDLKHLGSDELNTLAEEIRETLIKRITITGGHMGSNLGIIEATIALHYVFDSPKDKFIFDVSHQSYTHKILTGRKSGYTDPEKYYTLSGYTTPSESEHDIFKVGHTSTSVSLACGLAKARDFQNEKFNVIAVIGDGSLSGGEAFEGLNNAGKLDSNFIVLFNDNEMSIAPPQGALHDHFRQLRESKGECANNYFKLLGFDYMYIENGNDIPSLIEAFKTVKDTNHPVVVHIHTLKGKGLQWAIDDKEAGHWANSVERAKAISETNYQSETTNYFSKKVQSDDKLVVVTAATPTAMGLNYEFRKIAKERFIDVGICEEHAVAFVSAMAKEGMKPVFEVKSSFVQRTYDQLMQDLAMNNTPAVILVADARVSGGDCTHVGMYDIALVSSIPNLVCLAPSNLEQYLSALDYAINQNERSMVVRMPTGKVVHGEAVKFDNINIFKYKYVRKGEKIAVIGLGTYQRLADDVCKELIKYGFNPTLIDPVNYSQYDEETLEELKKNHVLTVVLEDGIVAGGFGEKIARYYGPSEMKTLCYGAQKNFNDLMDGEDVLLKSNLTKNQIVSDILKLKI